MLDVEETYAEWVAGAPEWVAGGRYNPLIYCAGCGNVSALRDMALLASGEHGRVAPDGRRFVAYFCVVCTS